MSYTAATRRGSTTATGTGTNVGGTPGNYTAAITLNKPSGVVDGDLLFTVIATDGSAVGLVQTLSGWTAMGFNPLRPTTDGQRVYVFWKIASGEGASWTWSTDTNNGNDWTGTVVAYSGQNATWNTDTAHSTVNSSANSSPVSVSDSGVTTSLDNTLLLYIGAGDPNTNNSGSWSDPSGYTAGSQSYANYAPLMFADKVQATAGASGSVAGSLSFASGAAGFAAAVIPITGTASSSNNASLTATLGAATLSATAALPIAASVSKTLGAATLAATAQLPEAASLSVTLGAATLSATAALPISASLGATLGAATLASAVTTGASNNASLTVTLGAASLSATAALLVSAALNATLGAAALSATAAVVVSASLGATLGAATLDAQANTGTPRNASLDVVLGAATLAATATTGGAPAYVGGGGGIYRPSKRDRQNFEDYLTSLETRTAKLRVTLGAATVQATASVVAPPPAEFAPPRTMNREIRPTRVRISAQLGAATLVASASITEDPIIAMDDEILLWI